MEIEMKLDKLRTAALLSCVNAVLESAPNDGPLTLNSIKNELEEGLKTINTYESGFEEGLQPDDKVITVSKLRGLLGTIHGEAVVETDMIQITDHETHEVVMEITGGEATGTVPDYLARQAAAESGPEGQGVSH